MAIGVRYDLNRNLFFNNIILKRTLGITSIFLYKGKN